MLCESNTTNMFLFDALSKASKAEYEYISGRFKSGETLTEQHTVQIPHRSITLRNPNYGSFTNSFLIHRLS